MLKFVSDSSDFLVYVINGCVEFMARRNYYVDSKIARTDTSWYRMNRDEVLELHKMLTAYLEDTGGL